MSETKPPFTWEYTKLKTNYKRLPDKWIKGIEG